ncbi:MAG: M15 family metallopeptidase [Leptolyngbyaceae cyanobacterium SM2_3_12]|nr:M15 family metallopeptidase [Leptolyngbyaceae cyanobacterium SM2_3_12]
MIPIQDCQEPLVPIPLNQFTVVQPHPYVVLNAPYGPWSPYFLRRGVLAALTQAQSTLQAQYPGWRLQIFDAFRPIPVQRFMVNHTFRQLWQTRYPAREVLSTAQTAALMAEVVQFWAMPSEDPTTPPPHSTGAALDITLVDAHGLALPMGSPIDEVSPRSFPNHFAQFNSAEAQGFHHHRSLLNQVMETAGFRRHPQEWWHFSLGDQLWAWLRQQETGEPHIQAQYGRAPEHGL